MSYKPVPVAAAERISKDYDKEQVVIISVDKEHNQIHFTTYGDTATDKLDAARSVNIMKIEYFGLEVPDGEDAPFGFEDFEWNNDKRDFVEKEK